VPTYARNEYKRKTGIVVDEFGKTLAIKDETHAQTPDMALLFGNDDGPVSKKEKEREREKEKEKEKEVIYDERFVKHLRQSF